MSEAIVQNEVATWTTIGRYKPWDAHSSIRNVLAFLSTNQITATLSVVVVTALSLVLVRLLL